MPHITKILLIRQLAMGDVILTTPIIRQLQADHAGQCLIDVLTLKPDVFKNNPRVHKTLSPQEYLDNKEGYDIIINLDLAYEKQPKIHIIDAYARISHGDPKYIKNRQVELFSTLNDKLAALKLIKDEIQDPYLVIHMRHDTWPSRNLSIETWKNIVDLLLRETDYKIVQIGGDKEIAFDHDPRLINKLGKASIHIVKELIESAQFYFGIDSGTLHIASATRTPIICMFTSAHADLRMPLDRPSSAQFIALRPDIACYGCQSKMPPPITGVVCTQGDPYAPPCREAFNIEEIKKSIMSLS